MVSPATRRGRPISKAKLLMASCSTPDIAERMRIGINGLSAASPAQIFSTRPFSIGPEASLRFAMALSNKSEIVSSTLVGLGPRSRNVSCNGNFRDKARAWTRGLCELKRWNSSISCSFASGNVSRRRTVVSSRLNGFSSIGIVLIGGSRRS